MQTLRSSVLRPATVVAATVVLASSFAGRASAATYRSANGFQITPPAGWTTSKGVMGSEVVFMGPTRENINVVSQTVPRGTTLEKARAETIKLWPRMMTGYKVLGQGTTTLGGTRALTLTSGYEMGSPPQRLRAFQAFALRGGRIYVFTCTGREATYSRYAATFQKSLRTVRWTR
jgi:hypothetical protein